MKQPNIENQTTQHTWISNKERVAWAVLAVTALVLGIVINISLAPHSQDQQASALTQQQQIKQQPTKQHPHIAMPISGQVVSISHTGTWAGTIHLRVSFIRTNNPTFQNPIPLPHKPNFSTQKITKGIKIITVSFARNTIFLAKKASEIKIGDYLTVRSFSGNYVSGKPFVASQVFYFNPINRIGQMATGNGHTFFGKITAIKTTGSSKTITVNARIVNKKEFVTVLSTKVAARPYPHKLLRGDMSYINKSYSVVINSNILVGNTGGESQHGLTVGTTVVVSGKENIYATDKITATSLEVLPAQVRR